jgi:hypothetical protein
VSGLPKRLRYGRLSPSAAYDNPHQRTLHPL